MGNPREAHAAVAMALLCFACTDVQNKRTSGTLRESDAGALGTEAGSESEAGAGKRGTIWPVSGAGGNSGATSNGGVGGEGGASGAPAAQSGAGAQAGAAAGSGGTAMQSGQGPVRGTLIDAWRRPLPKVELHIGDQTVMTDDLGKFTAEGVASSYDIAFRLMTVAFRDGAPVSSVWRFEGLTRRDPTLQVYPTFELQSADVTFRTRGATFPLSEDQRIQTAIGSPHGDCGTGVNTEVYEWSGCYWDGPSTTTATAHGVLLRVAGDDELPLEYLAYAGTPLTLAAGVTSEVDLDFSHGKPPMGSVTGVVSAGGQGARSNWTVLRWTDGSSILLGADENTSDPFSYVIPTIPDASTAVVALRGRNFEYPLAVAFADNVTAGQTGIQIDVPLSAAVVAPGDGQANVDRDTMFQWSGDAKVYLFVAETADFKELMHVVTSAQKTRLPVLPAAPYTPPAGAVFNWHVETHGGYASVDEAAGSEGLISAFFANRLQGPRRGAGSYTASARRKFTTAL